MGLRLLPAPLVLSLGRGWWGFLLLEDLRHGPTRPAMPWGRLAEPALEAEAPTAGSSRVRGRFPNALTGEAAVGLCFQAQHRFFPVVLRRVDLHRVSSGRTA